MKTAISSARRGRLLRKRTLVAAVQYFVLAAVLVLFFLPMLWGLSTSFKVEEDVFQTITSFFPRRWTVQNYVDVFGNPYTPILRWFFNSVKISVTYVLLYLFVTSLAAFGFSRLRFRGREVLFWICMSSMMVPGVINMIPNYFIVYRLGLIDNMFSMVLPGLSGVFGVFMLRQFMMDVPKEYDDAARIDGAGKFRIYLNIVLPLCLPALVTLALFSFQATGTTSCGLSWSPTVRKRARSRRDCPHSSSAIRISTEGCLLAEYDCAAKAFTLDRRRTLHPVRGNAREREGVRSVCHDCGGTLNLIMTVCYRK